MDTTQKETHKPDRQHGSSFLNPWSFLGGIGIALIAFGTAILLLTFLPVVKEEALYTVRTITTKGNKTTIQPIDREFGIVIPKLGANAHVIPNVDPYDHDEYQRALTRGVAHARGTVYPGDVGNIFLFSHSSVNFYEASRYNSIFYLINKLEVGDAISLYYKGNRFDYTLKKKTMADPSDVSFLTRQTTKKELTLMTCWPPGTTYKRLMVVGELH